MNKFIHLGFVVAASLVGCGGGGGEVAGSGSGSFTGGGGGSGGGVVQAPSSGGGFQAPATEAEYPVDQAFGTFFSTASTFTVNATDSSGNTYSLTHSMVPGPVKTNASISATAKSTTQQVVSIRVNGSAPISSAVEYFYTYPPFAIAGANDDGVIYRATSSAVLPTTAKVGASGSMGTWEYWDGAKFVAAPDPRWSLESDTSTTAWLCIELKETDNTGTYTEKDCIKINQAGVISAFKSNVTAPGIALAFK